MREIFGQFVNTNFLHFLQLKRQSLPLRKLINLIVVNVPRAEILSLVFTNKIDKYIVSEEAEITHFSVQKNPIGLPKMFLPDHVFRCKKTRGSDKTITSISNSATPVAVDDRARPLKPTFSLFLAFFLNHVQRNFFRQSDNDVVYGRFYSKYHNKKV